MREILFKAKRTDNGEWVEGDLIQAQNKKYIAFGWSIDNEGEQYYNFDCTLVYEIDPITVCQYTGLKDKNGVKVWEGDKMTFGAYGIHYAGFVEFVNGSFGVNCEVAHPFLDDAINRHGAVVIGNIHDNT